MIRALYRMRRRAVGGATASAICLVVAVVAPTSASAGGPTIAASPTKGVSGASVTISGGTWPGDDSIEVFLDQGSNSTFMCTVDTASTGAIEPATCTVPTSLPQGAYTLKGSDATLSATSAFTLDPGVTVSGFNGSAAVLVGAGQKVGVVGSGFAPNSAVHATFAGSKVTVSPAATTSSSGGFSGSSVTVPSGTAAGVYPLVVSDAGGHAATVKVTVFAATLSVSPSPVVAGSTVSFAGSGWPSNDRVDVYFVQGTTETFLCETDITGDGSLAQSCAAPTDLTQGGYTVVGTDQSLSVSTHVTLDPGVTVSGFNGSAAVLVGAGQKVGVVGSGFAPNSAVHATFAGSKVTVSPAATTSSSGGFSGSSVTVPSGTAAGAYPLVVSDAGGHAATVKVTVFAATLSVSPSPVVAGSTVSFAGSGWPSNDRVDVYFVQGTTETFLCETDIAGDGSLAQSCAAPTDLTQGGYTVVGTDQSLSVSTHVTLDPGIALTNSSGAGLASAAPGTAADLAGSGFASNSDITKVTIGSHTVAFDPKPVCSAGGAFSAAAFTVPSLAAGTYVVTATDAAGHSGTAQLKIT